MLRAHLLIMRFGLAMASSLSPASARGALVTNAHPLTFAPPQQHGSTAVGVHAAGRFISRQRSFEPL